MHRFWRDHGLTITMFGLFAAFAVGLSIAGFHAYNEELQGHGLATLSFGAYLVSSHFWEALAENWESEFLEMGLYVLLTALLFQKGSAESRDPDEPEPLPEQHAGHLPTDAPWPVKKGGWVLRLYCHSLSIALLGLFAISFGLHLYFGTLRENQDLLEHHQPSISVAQFAVSSQFWFESFQNWQSEFLGVAMLIVLSIYLRQQRSSQSKPVEAPNEQTGGK